jgi:hypothetical protein
MSEKWHRFFERSLSAGFDSRGISYRALDTQKVEDVLDYFMALMREELPRKRVREDLARRPYKIAGRYFRHAKACDQREPLDASARYSVVYLVGHANLGYEITGANSLADLWLLDEVMFITTRTAGASYFVGHHGDALRVSR